MALPEESISIDEQSGEKHPNLFELIKEEPIDEGEIKIEDPWRDEIAIKEEEISNDNMNSNLFELVKEEPIDEGEIKIEDPWGDEIAMKDEEMDHDNVDASESLGYSDGDFEPLMKKPKGESLKMKNKKSSEAIQKKSGSASSKRNSREMNCTECDFLTTAASSFVTHLRKKHSTSLALAGLALRCDCGVEVRSFHHGYKCDIANFTIVRKRRGPIQRLHDEKTTPQCLLCDAYPKSPDGYIAHLRKHHNSSLKDHGVSLQCSCGMKYHNSHPNFMHPNKCTRREYSLHKIGDE